MTDISAPERHIANATAEKTKRSYRRRALHDALHTGIVWENPPDTRPPSRGAPSTWTKRLALVDARPGHFGRLALYDSGKDASNVASYLRSVVNKRLDGRYEIHARQITVQEPVVDENGDEVLIPVSRGAIYARLIASDQTEEADDELDDLEDMDDEEDLDDELDEDEA